MDLDLAIEEYPVTTVLTTCQAADPASAEQRLMIGGTVRNLARAPVRDAWVLLEPAGLTRITDESGRFIFEDVARGAGMTLRARAPGYGETPPANFELPSLSGNYDLQFPI
jgi:hypothetical protein